MKLLRWMEYMHLDASSSSMKVRICQFRLDLGSLSAAVPVKYTAEHGFPLKFSAVALGLLLDLVVDRLRGTVDDDDVGTIRMRRLQQASVPLTDESECAARRHADCITKIHTETFARPQPILLSKDSEERSSAAPLPPPLPSGPPPILGSAPLLRPQGSPTVSVSPLQDEEAVDYEKDEDED